LGGVGVDFVSDRSTTAVFDDIAVFDNMDTVIFLTLQGGD